MKPIVTLKPVAARTHRFSWRGFAAGLIYSLICMALTYLALFSRGEEPHVAPPEDVPRMLGHAE